MRQSCKSSSARMIFNCCVDCNAWRTIVIRSCPTGHDAFFARLRVPRFVSDSEHGGHTAPALKKLARTFMHTVFVKSDKSRISLCGHALVRLLSKLETSFPSRNSSWYIVTK
jgi:hypothetical protein